MKDKFNNAVGPQARQVKAGINTVALALTLLCLMAGLATATQYFAHQFHYQRALGMNLNGVYAPWDIVRWAIDWYRQYPRIFLNAMSFGGLVTGLGFLIIAIGKVIRKNTANANQYLHGSARWANKKDLIAAGLIRGKTNNTDSHYVYVGGWVDKKGKFHYLRHSGPEHILTYAPTRSGKGVGLVVPTLLAWGGSTVVADLKGELWALTAGWRQKHAQNKVLRFEPASLEGSVHWNPLDEIRLGSEYEVGDVQNLATLIVDPDGKGLNDHWQKTSQALLVGLILHVLYKAKHEGHHASLPMVDQLLSNPGKDVSEVWSEMVSYPHLHDKVHPVVGAAGRDMIDRPDEEGGSVLSTAKSYLSLYRDPVVAKNVERSDFKIEDLMNHVDPVSLYIVTQPNDKSRLRPLVRVLINMIVRLLANKQEFENGRPKVTYNHKLLMMLDEFPSLGKLDILQESLAFIATYGIKCYLICQDINQLKSRETGYGPDELITSSCHIQNAYPPNRIETAEFLSKLTGTTTVVKEKISVSGKRASAILGNVSKHMEEVSRPLLTPDECLRMQGPKKDHQGNIVEAGDMVVYAAGCPAIYGRQSLFFKDPIFLARAAIPPPDESDRIGSAIDRHKYERISL